MCVCVCLCGWVYICGYMSECVHILCMHACECEPIIIYPFLIFRSCEDVDSAGFSLAGLAMMGRCVTLPHGPH